MSTLPREGVEVAGILNASSMLTDSNRNIIVENFLKASAEHLFWMDADVSVPAGGVRQLLDSGKTMISGLYFLKQDNAEPVAYWRDPEHTGYKTIGLFERGDIIQVDAAGMGCMLTHRSVFEDIIKNYERWETPNGGDVLVHKADIKSKNHPRGSRGDDYKFVDDELRIRVRPPTCERRFPFFQFAFGRTEDMHFVEHAQRSGHALWLDTSVVCTHWGGRGYDYNDWALNVPGWIIATKKGTATRLEPGSDFSLWEAWREDK
jgi:hypothetical protein